MTSNNAQTSQTPETLRNFDDFNNMFKGIDHNNCVPGDVAHKILLKVKLEHSQSRYNDVCMWIESSHFFSIKRNVALSDCVPDDDDTYVITVGKRYDDIEEDIYYGSDFDSDNFVGWGIFDDFDDTDEVSDIED